MIFQSALEQGVAMGLDACQWNVSTSSLKNFCLICLSGSLWPETLFPLLDQLDLNSPAHQLLRAELLPAWVSSD